MSTKTIRVSTVNSEIWIPGEPSEITIVQSGPIGPPGAVGGGALYMEKLVYDAGGSATNVYDLANSTGNLDGGTFA